MTTEKTFDFYAVLNWKNGKVKVYSRRPKKVTPFEVPIRLIIKAKIPEVKELVATGEIEISETKVNEMIIEEL